MALTKATGTNNSWGTEYFLLSGSTTMTPVTTDARVQVFIDLSALIAGDQVQIIVYEKANTSTARAVFDPSYPTGVQSTLWVSPALSLDEGYDIGVKLMTGSNRTITWSVRSSDDLGGGATAASQTSMASTLSTILSAVDTEVAAILAAVDTEVASIKTTVEALPSAAAVATAVMASVIETGYTLTNTLRIVAAAAAGKLSGVLAGTLGFRSLDDSKTRISGTTSTDGRPTVTYDIT